MSDRIMMVRDIEDEPQKLVLSVGDKISPTWRKLVEHLENELKICRGKNDNIKLDEIQTAAIRGQIATLKALITLGDTSPVITTDG